MWVYDTFSGNDSMTCFGNHPRNYVVYTWWSIEGARYSGLYLQRNKINTEQVCYICRCIRQHAYLYINSCLIIWFESSCISTDSWIITRLSSSGEKHILCLGRTISGKLGSSYDCRCSNFLCDGYQCRGMIQQIKICLRTPTSKETAS